MRSRTLLLALLAAVLVLSPAQAATFTISITKGGFAPSALTVAIGDTVTWRNDDTSSHQVVSKSAGFTSPLLAPGGAFSFTYKEAGRFAYQDATAKKNRGTVTVQGAAPAISVTAAASSRLVVYGATVTLTGVTSSKRSGESVTILAQPYGATAYTALGSALTGGGGDWSFSVRPRLQTLYQARWKPATITATSAPVDVRVRPQVLIRVKSASGRRVTFWTKARAARSLAGKSLLLQRRNRFGQWVSLKKATLAATSTATVRVTLPSGRSRVRMFMPQRQAGAGYLAGISRTLTLTR